MKARLENGIVVEFLYPLPGKTIEECFHPTLLAQCVDYVDGMVIGEPVPAPVEPPAP